MTTSTRWAQIEELFHRASECDPQDRDRMLAAACHGDLELQHEVEALLANQQSATRDIDAAMLDGLDAVIFPLVGATISHYRILDGLGVGGMGLLYRAEDIRLGRKVALKFLPEESAKDAAALARFEREARSLSALEHPNICSVHEFGEHEGQPFLVMPLLEGCTLREMISARGRDKPPLEISQLLDFAIQIANGLETAHRHGIIHRDIKPANVFVTTEGQLKILDFGLAKLRQPEIAEEPALSGDTKQQPDASVTFTATGVAMGTAGYMSPEQVRGEELDARTDLFSFGVVLYEMATGQPAFRGETVAMRCKAILNDTPIPARKVNPELPSRLEAVLNKALMKDRAARYQNVSEMRADLEALKLALESKGRRAAFALAAFALTVLAAAVLWFSRYYSAQNREFPEITQRQLTANPGENIVAAGAISPNGQYLAYCDQHGLQVEMIQTGQTRTVAQGKVCTAERGTWRLAWFPNGATILASGSAWWARPGVWSVPVEAGPIHKLRDDADAGSISPDGSTVAFATRPGDIGNREIWLMNPDGSDARKLYETEEHSEFDSIRWSPDGQRLAYVKYHFLAGEFESKLESRDLKGGPPIVIASPAPDDYHWMSDGRVILARSDPNLEASNLCELHVDPRTGQPQGKPRQLTNWAGFSVDNLSATTDSKKLAFRRWTYEEASYVAELSGEGTRITTPKRVTLVDGASDVMAWTPESNAILMSKVHNGVRGIYKQSVEKVTAELILTGLASGGVAQIRSSPDRASVFYWAPAKQTPTPGRRAPVWDLMRVPIAGGPSRLVLSSSSVVVDVRCAKSPAKLCVLLEEGNGGEMTFTGFDPVKGRDGELFKIGGLNPENWEWGWDVSPDGRSVAFIKNDGKISILSLHGRLLKEIAPKGWAYIYAFDGAVDGKGWFTTGRMGARQGLLHVDLQGNARLLWPNSASVYINYAIPSPDGRRLAIQATAHTSSNIWMIENF
jgi:eukaryotic-like serine/threonine-protein kinase